MRQNKQDIELGRFLSYVLRHRPSAAGIELDAHGWAEVEPLLEGCNRVGKKIDRAALERIVRENGKQRYSLSEDGARIRANQGHSLKVDVELPEAEPPAVLYHGTATRFLPSIRAEGLRRGSRQHVHLSEDRETALQVGRRHGEPALLRVNAAAMYRDGRTFYRSENGVWLCESVPREYLLH